MEGKSWHSVSSNVRVFGAIACIWIAIIGVSYGWNWYQSARSAIMFAEAEARASYDKDLLYRRWAALQGGVYVQPTTTTPANPYLSHLPDRDLITSEGKRLTLVNPAYMARQVHFMAKEQSETFGHLTSLTPLNPINAADSWETEALLLFEKGVGEITTKESVNGEDYIRLMRPMMTEKPCLKCHAAQGYKEGQIRGGISVSVPFASYAAAAGQQQLQLLWAHVLIACVGLLGLWKGISLIHSTAVSLLESKDLHNTLASLVPGVIYQYRLFPDGRSAFPYASPGMSAIYEVTPEEVREDATPVFERLHPEDRDRVTADIFESAKTLDTYYSEFRVILPRQGLRWRWSQAQPQRMEDGSTLWHGIISDITERKQAEEALRKSEERLNFALQMNHTGGWELDLTSNSYVRTLEHDRIFGYETSLSLWTYKMFIEHVVPDERPDVEGHFQESVALKTDLNFECRIRRTDGEIRWIWVAGCHLPEILGQERRMAGIIQDVTDRKKAEAEKEKLHAQLTQAQKMESVGRLAGGVAHDYNNMLGVILGYTEMALEKVAPEEPLHTDLKEILKATNRSSDITRQLLAFSRRQAIALKKLNLNATVEGMLRMLRRLIGEDIDLVWKPKANIWPVKMDPSQLDQILVNLCVNARDAISDVGKIVIETGMTTFDTPYCDDHAECIPGDYVMLAVSDDGCGMSKEIQENLFEPFFTTKEIGKGTGLGLATVYGIVKQNRGVISVYSEPGHGSSFTIYLPSDPSEVGSLSRVSGTRTDVQGKETILLVEDEEKILKMTTAMLERLGYRVIVAGTPDDAMELARSVSCDIHLLMTDVIMPRMNGRQLAQHLQSNHPNLRVLFMSGYTENIIAHHGVLEEGVNYIQKPFKKNELSIKLREVLDASM